MDKYVSGWIRKPGYQKQTKNINTQFHLSQYQSIYAFLQNLEISGTHSKLLYRELLIFSDRLTLQMASVLAQMPFASLWCKQCPFLAKVNLNTTSPCCPWSQASWGEPQPQYDGGWTRPSYPDAVAACLLKSWWYFLRKYNIDIELSNLETFLCLL